MKRTVAFLFVVMIIVNHASAQKAFTYLADFTNVSYYGFADSAGNTKTGGRYNLIMQPAEGICRVWAGQTSGNDYTNIRYGYCLTNGTEIVPPKYPRAEDFSGGLARVATGGFLDGYKYGFINTKGVVEIPLQYKDARDFSQGLAAVSTGEKQWKYIDKTGKVVIEGPFLDAGNFSEGLAGVSIPYDLGSGVMSFKKGYIDLTGKMVIKPEYNYVTPFSYGYAVASVSESTPSGYKNYQVLIDKTGKRLTTQEFVTVYQFPSDGLYAVKIKGGTGLNGEGDEWGVVDKKGVLQGCRAKQQLYFNEGLAVFRENDLYGFMDKTGKVIIKPQFKNANGFNEGLAAVSDAPGNWGYVNKKGEFVIKPTYISASRFNEGIAVVSKGKSAYDAEKLTGAIDKTGKLIIPMEKRSIGDFKNGRALAEQSYVSYYIYKNGKTSLACDVNTLANGRYALASLYKNDMANALRLLDKEKNAGCPMTDYWLGYVLLQSQRPARDTVQGAALVEKAAKAGYPEAQYSLGIVYVNGLGGKKDTAAAKEYFVKAAKAGVPAANTALGVLEDKINPIMASGYYLKAADMGEPTAMYNLSLLYREGRGVSKSDADFKLWLSRATERQYPAAVQLQSQLQVK